MTAESSDSDLSPRPAVHIWCMRLVLCIVFPLVLFLSLEIALRLAGYGEARTFFIPDREPGFVRTNPHFTELVFPAQFGIEPMNFRIQRKKPENTIRIFVLGESAARGVPEPGFGMAPLLEAQLRPRFPTRRIEVLNLGVTAINSHLIYRIARELPALGPDLIVVYAGNNEVIGPYGPGSAHLAEMLPLPMIRLALAFGTTRTGQLLERVIEKATKSQRALEWRGMRTFLGKTVRGDDAALEKVYANFDSNLEGIAKVGRKADCPVIFCTVAANLKDSAPFASLHRPGWTEADDKSFQSFFKNGVLAFRERDWTDAIQQLSRSVALDPTYADAEYMLGKAYEARREPDKARSRFNSALHWDALRFRPDAPINEVIRKVAQRNAGRSLLVDCAMELGFDPRSTQPISGAEQFWEHVHLRWEGNYRVALMVAEKASERLRHTYPVGDGVVTESVSAEMLGLTDYGRFAMANSMAGLMAAPPFTHEIDFAKAISRVRREVATLREKVFTGEELAEAADLVDRAWRNDPSNTFLAGHLAQIRTDIGDLERALALIDQWKKLLSDAPEVNVQEADVLVKMRRFTDAEQALEPILKSGRMYFPAYSAALDVWTSTQQLEKAQEIFEGLLRRYPTSEFLRLKYADCLVRRNDLVRAEAQFRSVLEQDPECEVATEELVRLLMLRGQQNETLPVMLEAQRYQPRNYSNHTRLAAYFDAHNEYDHAVDEMVAMTESGPVNAHFRGQLAHRLFGLHRYGEMKVQLLEARDQAIEEGDFVFATEVERVMKEQSLDPNQP